MSTNTEHFPVHLNRKPTCELTEQWKRIEADGSETIRYAGADGYLYEKRGQQGVVQDRPTVNYDFGYHDRELGRHKTPLPIR